MRGRFPRLAALSQEGLKAAAQRYWVAPDCPQPAGVVALRNNVHSYSDVRSMRKPNQRPPPPHHRHV